MNEEIVNQSDQYKFSKSVFERFDPLTCSEDDLKIPINYSWSMYGVILRARYILSSRSPDEIYYAADTLDYIEAQAGHEISMEAMKRMSKTGEKLIATSKAMAYYGYIPLFDITGQSDFKNAKWCEYFAVLALTRVGLVINAFNRKPSKFEKQFGIDIEDTREQRAFDHSIDAAEAIAYAECLQGESNRLEVDLDSEADKRVSLRNQQAAIKRFSEKNEIKDEFIIYFESGGHVSRADASRKFFRSLPESKKKYFREDTVERNLLDHLRKYYKE